MRKTLLISGICGTLIGLLAIIWAFQSEKTIVTHPKGLIAHQQLRLIAINVALMLLILLPTLAWLLWTAWKYSTKNSKTDYDPKKRLSVFGQSLLWIIPTIIVTIMSVITWKKTHALDPYKPIVSEKKALQIQVVALDWKWLFIYPEQNIATVNFVQIPEKTPIHFTLAADGSPMNSFWIPQLCGQIYCMTGMITPLHMMADGLGEYSGKAAEINGIGYAGMTFKVKSSTEKDFEVWVEAIKQSPQELTLSVYNDLVKPSEKHPVTFYSNTEKDLFNTIVMKYFHPSEHKK